MGSVVIHEFELVDRAEPERGPAEAKPDGHAAARRPATPREVGRVLRQLAERLARVRAH